MIKVLPELVGGHAPSRRARLAWLRRGRFGPCRARPRPISRSHKAHHGKSPGRPLPSHVQHTQHADDLALGNVIDQQAIPVHDELAGFGHPARPAELGMACETRRLRAYQLIKGDGRPWAVGRDLFPDGPAII